VPLFLTEADVTALVDPGEAVDIVEESFRHLAEGSARILPRSRVPLEHGSLNVMAAVDDGLGYAGVKAYTAGAEVALLLFDAETRSLAAVIESVRLGQLRTGAASGVAARHLVRPDAMSLGVIGCGRQAETQLECIRAVVPSIERVVCFCRTPESLAEFCGRFGAEPAESHREAGEQDVVVTITSSRDPVLRGEWLRPGALVCAAGANDRRRRELDNVVLQRAAFVCCDSREQARIESGDLVEPIEAGVLDWLEVHELQEVVTGEVAGRQADDDIVLFKSNGIAAWDVALAAAALQRARERGLGREL
jgi:ornithine cyclodeaminase/alanine dehydrogenase-like protein (mu-crystallin family)